MKNEKHARYHIKLKAGFILKKGYKTITSTSGLTSISLNKTLDELLAIKLKTTPRSKEARSAITKQLQEFTKHYQDCGSHGLSRRLTDQVILYLIDNELLDKYHEFHKHDHDEIEPGI